MTDQNQQQARTKQTRTKAVRRGAVARAGPKESPLGRLEFGEIPTFVARAGPIAHLEDQWPNEDGPHEMAKNRRDSMAR